MQIAVIFYVTFNNVLSGVHVIFAIESKDEVRCPALQTSKFRRRIALCLQKFPAW